jgi:hypothetical protein
LYGRHGWQVCGDRGTDTTPSAGRANFNLIIGGAIDPVSGSVPHRAYLCQVHPAE